MVADNGDDDGDNGDAVANGGDVDRDVHVDVGIFDACDDAHACRVFGHDHRVFHDRDHCVCNGDGTLTSPHRRQNPKSR